MSISGLLGRAGRDRGAALLPRLVAQRVGEHRLVDRPALAPGDLQDEHVVDVVVRREALVLRRGDVGVDLHRVAELGGQPGAEVDQRRPGAVQGLQHERGAVGERAEHLVVGDLVGDRRRRRRRRG